MLDVPVWANRLVLMLMATGFPAVVIFAWVYEIIYLLYDPFILRYKDDPRFASFCRKVGLPTPAEVAAHKT